MKENITSRVVKCPICKTCYVPEIGEICECETPDPQEEPKVRDFEDVKVVSQL